MRIYTRTGDDGSTGLFGGSRIGKDELRIEAYGTIDELNAILGVARAAGLVAPVAEYVEQLQGLLFELGSQLATAPETQTAGKARSGSLTAADVALLEHRRKDSVGAGAYNSNL